MPCGPNPFRQQIQSSRAEMSARLSARRLAVETIRSDMFDGVVLASTLESLARYYRFMSSFVGEDVRPRHLADIATEGTASRRLNASSVR